MGALKVWDGTMWQTVSQEGPAGAVGLPVGGLTGTPLLKTSATDYAVGWPAGITFDTRPQYPGHMLNTASNVAGAGAYPYHAVARSRGTLAAPTAPLSGDYLHQFLWNYQIGATGYNANSLAVIAAEDFSASTGRTAWTLSGWGSAPGTATVSYGERLRLIHNMLCIGTAPALADVQQIGRIRVNDRPTANNAIGSVQLTASQSNIPALQLFARTDQSAGTLWSCDSAGNIKWHLDKTGYPKQFVQGASTVVNTDGNGFAFITFPEPFLASIPAVTANEGGGAGFWCSVKDVQASGFTIMVRNAAGTVVSGTIRISWMAFENRP